MKYRYGFIFCHFHIFSFFLSHKRLNVKYVLKIEIESNWMIDTFGVCVCLWSCLCVFSHKNECIYVWFECDLLDVICAHIKLLHWQITVANDDAFLSLFIWICFKFYESQAKKNSTSFFFSLFRYDNFFLFLNTNGTINSNWFVFFVVTHGFVFCTPRFDINLLQMFAVFRSFHCVSAVILPNHSSNEAFSLAIFRIFSLSLMSVTMYIFVLKKKKFEQLLHSSV